MYLEIWDTRIPGPAGERTIAGRNVRCTGALAVLSTGPNETRPAATGGTSTIELTAKVTQGGSPKAGVGVSFSVVAEYASGGHASHSGMRPTGSIPASGTSDANGEIKLTYQAGAFSGKETIVAVEVKGLTQLEPDAVTPASYTLRGSTQAHPSSHWFSRSAIDALNTLIRLFNVLGWRPVGVNDASLSQGGSFDVPGRWVVGSNHAEHRIGEEVDISFAVGADAGKIKRAYDDICLNGKMDMPTTVLWHDIPLSEGGKYAPHFHVRLNGQYTTMPNIGRPALYRPQAGRHPCVWRQFVQKRGAWRDITLGVKSSGPRCRATMAQASLGGQGSLRHPSKPMSVGCLPSHHGNGCGPPA